MRLLPALLLGCLLCIGNNIKAITYTAVANGTWSSASTWSPAGIPASSDTVMIGSYTVGASTDITIGTNYGGQLIISKGAKLDMGSNNLSMNHQASIKNSGTLIAGEFVMNDATVFVNNGTVNVNSFELNTTSSFNNSGSFTAGEMELDNSSTFTSTGTVNVGSLELNQSTVFTDNGSMTVSTSIELNASSSLNVGSNITLYDNGSFSDNSSTAITDNGAILISGTATFYGGSNISGTGYLTGGEIQNYHNNSVWGVTQSFFPCTNCTIPTNSPLPVDLLSFTGTKSGEGVQLHWTTASETNNAYFTLSRSTDGVNFSNVATVKGAGNSAVQHSYTYNDNTVSGGENYYRLQQTDFDGTTTTDGIVAVTIATSNKDVQIIPNPVKDNSVISFHDNMEENVQLNVFDCTGREIFRQAVHAVKGGNVVKLHTSMLPAGVYFISFPIDGSPIKAEFVRQ